MKLNMANSNLSFITSDIITDLNNIKHGFFTRNGGVSSGIYQTLNCGLGSKDDKKNIAQNRAKAASALGNYAIADLSVLNRLYGLNQIHSNDVIVIDSLDIKPYQYQAADALITNIKGIFLSVLSADCLPILFADNKANIIAATHAGWRGSLGGVVENTISKMLQMGASLDNIVAAIGPSISQKNYEVGAELYDNFVGFDKNNAKFFIESHNEGCFLFCLNSYVKAKLQKIGIVNIDNTSLCTYENEDLFFSYRRSCHKKEDCYGRNISIITLND